MPYTSENPKKVGSYTKLKKPKDLPKSPVNKGNVSPMIAPNLYVKPQRVMIPYTTADSEAGQMINPTAGPGMSPAGTTGGTGGVPAGTTGGPGGAPATLGSPGDVPGALSGDASGTATAGSMPGGYSPGGYGPAFYQNPDALAADVLAGMGITNPEMIDVFTDLAGVGTALDMIMNMSQGTEVSPVNETAAYIDAMMQGQLTPGGAAIDPNALIEMIMNADINSPLGAYMAREGPSGVNAMIQAALVAGGGNPYAQRGVMNMMDTQAQDYNRNLARIDPATADPYYQGLRNGPLGRYLG